MTRWKFVESEGYPTNFYFDALELKEISVGKCSIPTESCISCKLFSCNILIMTVLRSNMGNSKIYCEKEIS